MTEEFYPAQIYFVELLCEKCKIGHYQKVGNMSYMTDPISSKHKCNNCDDEILVQGNPYPRIEYKKL